MLPPPALEEGTLVRKRDDRGAGYYLFFIHNLLVWRAAFLGLKI